VVVRLPEPLGIHVQAWRRVLRDPTAARIVPHLTVVPPQSVAEDEVPAALAQVERAAAAAVPTVVELDGAATFLPDSPVAFRSSGRASRPCAAWRSPCGRPRSTAAPTTSAPT
jgi:2'-5' RNA ligase